MKATTGKRIYVATRKGLVEIHRSDASWTVGRCHFLADPVTAFFMDSRDQTLYAALNLGHFGVKLHRSDDGGDRWLELPAPAYPSVEGESEDGPSVSLVWSLEGGGPDRPGRLWAGTLPGGLFKSEDRGETWNLVESLWDRPERGEWFGGGFDVPGIHSVLVDPRDSDAITVGVSCGGVWKSADAGSTWELVGQGLHADYMPPDRSKDLAIQDPHRLAVCASQPDYLWTQHHNGIFKSADAGRTWKAIEKVQPSDFGFGVVVHPEDPQTAWFVPGVKDECRVPVDGKLVVIRTRDGGESFESLNQGLPEDSFDLVYRHALDIDASGERLVMGSTTGNLWISENGGDSWVLITAHLAPVYQVVFA